MKIGVLALQGAFIEHIRVLSKLGVSAIEIRSATELQSLDGLIIPGGESTSIIKIMQDYKLTEPLRVMAQKGFPLWGTCAGMICLARRVTNNELITLAVMDISIRRNAFGRQIDSFETDLSVPTLGQIPFHAIFIRAPIIENVGKSVEVLAKLPDGTPVAARQGRLLVTSFHPELTDDSRFHDYFLTMVN
jgi:pyridoxal 5'-phosphate synthase pdxT subunit